MADTARKAETMNEHPDWLAVGRWVEVTRYAGRSVAMRQLAKIERHTATQVVDNMGRRFKRSRSGDYEMTPAYIDYRTVIRPLEAGGPGVE